MDINECQICGKKCKNVLGVYCHLKSHGYKDNQEKLEQYFKKFFLDYYKKKKKHGGNKCLICGKYFDMHLAMHIIRIHKMSPDDYYKRFFPKEDICDGIISTCGNKKKFVSVVKGYEPYCKKCISKSKHPTQYLYWIRFRGIDNIDDAKKAVSNFASNLKLKMINKLKENKCGYDLYTAKNQI